MNEIMIEKDAREEAAVITNIEEQEQRVLLAFFKGFRLGQVMPKEEEKKQ